jgi:hypothetical protein
MRPHSGLQLAVLKLYRDVCRYARTRPAEEREQVLSYARAQFAKPVARTHVTRIEYLLGLGRRQLEVLRMAGTTGVQLRR